MDEEMVKNINEALEKMKVPSYNGEFYWRATDIELLLTDCTRKKLFKYIQDLEKKCKSDGVDTSHEIMPTRTQLSSDITKEPVDDYYLSRLICADIINHFNTAPTEPQKKPSGIKHKLKIFSIAIASLLLGGILSILAVFYIPLPGLVDLRNIYIATAMTTQSHRWLATKFFSEETINEVMSQEVPPALQLKTNKLFFNKKKENKIEITDISGVGFSGKLLKITDPSKVKIAISKTYGSHGEFLEKIVPRVGAVGGINASGFVDYNGKGNAAYAIGLLISDGKTYSESPNKKFDVVGFDKDDNLIIGNFTREELKQLNLRDAAEPFYILTVNGENRIKKGNGGYGLHPRTAIGQTADGTVLMLVIDGRQTHSIGATMKNVQDILVEHGAVNAAAMDGGSSSVMYYDGKVQTKPSNGTTFGRYLPSAFVVYQ